MILIQGISTIITEEMPNYLVSKIFKNLPASLTILKNDKAKFKGGLRNSLHTHCFYYGDEYFMCQDDLNYCFVK